MSTKKEVTNKTKKTTSKRATKNTKPTSSTVNASAKVDLENEVKQLKEANEFLTLNLRNLDAFLGDLINQLDENARPKLRWFGWSWTPRRWNNVTARLQVLVNLATEQRKAKEAQEAASGN
jgi:hypothetical protein